MTSEDAGTAASARHPQGGRRLWFALLVSLALNLLFVGLLAGGAWTRLQQSTPSAFSFGGTIEAMMADMPAQRRQAVEDLLNRYRDEVRPMWRKVGAARRQAVAALEADPYDEERARQALQEMQQAQLAARARLTDYMVEFVGQLTVEEREAFLSRFGQRRRGRRRN